MGTHTPGPWHAEFDSCGGYDCITDAVNITAPDGTTIATVDCRHALTNLFGRGSGIDSERHTAELLTRANGERIAACVNACEGIEDPAALLEELREYLRLQKTETCLDVLSYARDRMRHALNA